MQACCRCIMNDSADPFIQFDENGYCNYCRSAIEEKRMPFYGPGLEGKVYLEEKLREIKEHGKGHKYDCVMGLSGGLDSSYLLYLGYKWGLRILAVHVDDGFDTEVSVSNIQKLVNATGVDMITIRPDAEQYCALEKAYMKAGVPNLAIPQDNILIAHLYDVVRKNKIKYFLVGDNFSTECILQKGNTYHAMDLVNLRDIHRRFGEQPISKLKFISSYQKYFDMKVTGLKTLSLLNYVNYTRDSAFKELGEFCGFQYYGRKHLENIFTAFLQLYWLPNKFGVDKRTSHLSSMIISGQITRDQALMEMQEPLYDEGMMKKYISIICKKLHFTNEEFEQIMSAPAHQHDEYRTDKLAVVLRKILK